MLTDHATRILQFEEAHPRHTGRKEYLIITELGSNKARYYQELNRLLDDPEALAARPMLVRRLQRERARRVDARARRLF